jgi:hypothetical protein
VAGNPCNCFGGQKYSSEFHRILSLFGAKMKKMDSGSRHFGTEKQDYINELSLFESNIHLMY